MISWISLGVIPFFYWYFIIFTQPLRSGRIWHPSLSFSFSFSLSLSLSLSPRPILKQSLTGLISEFSFSLTSCLIKAEETSLPNYLPIAGGRIIGFIPFPRVLVLCEMQSVSSRIWTRVAVSISYGDNHYTTTISISRVMFLKANKTFSENKLRQKWSWKGICKRRQFDRQTTQWINFDTKGHLKYNKVLIRADKQVIKAPAILLADKT